MHGLSFKQKSPKILLTCSSLFPIKQNGGFWLSNKKRESEDYQSFYFGFLVSDRDEISSGFRVVGEFFAVFRFPIGPYASLDHNQLFIVRVKFLR